ncbi:MAG: hypothetical protein ACPHGV_00525 [Synechococcus sp.]
MQTKTGQAAGAHHGLDLRKNKKPFARGFKSLVLQGCRHAPGHSQRLKILLLNETNELRVQIFISINDRDIILANQLTNSTNFLALNLSEPKSIPSQDLTTQGRRTWRDHKVKLINTNFLMMIYK